MSPAAFKISRFRGLADQNQPRSLTASFMANDADNRETEGCDGRPYPLPTQATVRQLYGSAFGCAHPECRRSLYTVSDETGDRVLNSRVCV